MRSAAAVVLLQQFALDSLVLAVEDCRRLFVVFALLVLADNTFLFNHSLEAFDCFLKVLVAFNGNACHTLFSPSSPAEVPQGFLV